MLKLDPPRAQVHLTAGVLARHTKSARICYISDCVRYLGPYLLWYIFPLTLEMLKYTLYFIILIAKLWSGILLAFRREIRRRSRQELALGEVILCMLYNTFVVQRGSPGCIVCRYVHRYPAAGFVGNRTRRRQQSKQRRSGDDP